MLKYVSFDVVFQEIPNEVTLAINISGCTNHCHGCHSPWLWQNEGEVLDELSLGILLKRYGSSVTCICFMGGDSSPKEIMQLVKYIKQNNSYLKTAWYSGKDNLPTDFCIDNFDYIKLGRYIEDLGGLGSPNTNQKLYCNLQNTELF